MNPIFHKLKAKLIKTVSAICLSLLLIFAPFGQVAQAGKALMTGDFVQDTISVAENLKSTVDIPDDSADRSTAKDEALELITAYISRYRNRPQVNGTTSFTTMQTALNAMAGHYKTFKDRPIPEKLKARLNKELSRAEKIVQKEV
ncbi:MULTISPECIES: photosystem II protein Psb27 [Prochlorococcus]|uniref:photosystem II protein Psb27 n=1 Tax=Prochlorococcus TaxID=1218 RepID=UPI000533AEF9|nr:MULTISPECIES: photosystem II protein Psb27 [Prochlorococcus]KGG12884.1 Photosystem II protein Psb27 [Prochlorococcus sp. MIT 0601]